MNPVNFPLAATALKPQQIPMLINFPLEFGGAGDINKHQQDFVLKPQ